MNTIPIIQRLIVAAPILGGRVAGAADFNAEVEAVRLGLPCAFVMRSGGEVQGDPATLGEVIQMLVEEFAVVIAVDNSASTVGQPAEDNLDPVYKEVMEALLGWTDDDTHNSLVFVRDDHVGFDRSRLWHQMLFNTTSSISSLDGMS